jgi:hypothetical protein
MIALLCTCILTAGEAWAQNPSADLDIARNGTANLPISPVNFQNGDAGPSNSHYVEGNSVPFRAVLKNLSIGNHSLIIAWDIRHNGRMPSIISPMSTTSNRIHSLFPAWRETVDPLEAVRILWRTRYRMDPNSAGTIPAGSFGNL